MHVCTHVYTLCTKQLAQTAHAPVSSPLIGAPQGTFSHRYSLGPAFPKLNVEGSNPFARFGWGWMEGAWWWFGCGKPHRGEVGALLGLQALIYVIQSTGLAAF